MSISFSDAILRQSLLEYHIMEVISVDSVIRGKKEIALNAKNKTCISWKLVHCTIHLCKQTHFEETQTQIASRIFLSEGVGGWGRWIYILICWMTRDCLLFIRNFRHQTALTWFPIQFPTVKKSIAEEKGCLDCHLTFMTRSSVGKPTRMKSQSHSYNEESTSWLENQLIL